MSMLMRRSILRAVPRSTRGFAAAAGEAALDRATLNRPNRAAGDDVLGAAVRWLPDGGRWCMLDNADLDAVVVRRLPARAA